MTTGSELRERRESAGLSIEQLASLTSIRMGLITEMENNKFVHCGGDTYARGHLKNIAMKLGLEPNHFVEMYNSEHSMDQRAIHDLLAENNVATIPREEKTLSWKIPALISVVVLLIIGSVQIVMSNQSSEVVAPVVKESAAPAPTESAAPAPTESAAPAPTESAAPAPTPAPTETIADGTGPVTLKLSAVRGNSFINIVVDGKSVLKGSIFQGDEKSFKGKSSISLYLSNPAGVDVTHNGKLLAPLGGQNQEVRRTFR
jgi:cytoskeletal protein RodZ